MHAWVSPMSPCTEKSRIYSPKMLLEKTFRIAPVGSVMMSPLSQRLTNQLQLPSRVLCHLHSVFPANCEKHLGILCMISLVLTGLVGEGQSNHRLEHSYCFLFFFVLFVYCSVSLTEKVPFHRGTS